MSKQDILRYMRTSSKTDNEQILALVDRAIDIIEQKAQPKSLYRIFDCTVTQGVTVVNGVEFELSLIHI